MALVSNVPTAFHAEQEISLSDRNIVQPMTDQEISVSNKTTLGRLIPKIHIRQRKILGSNWSEEQFPQI